jgi:membrane-bound serine protease (ClpP class)
MDSSHFAILLLFLGVALLVAEIFIPSGGMILVLALVCLVGSIWCAWKAWGTSPLAWWSYVVAVILLLPAAVGGGLYLFPRTPLGKRFLLEAPSLEEVTAYSDDERQLEQKIGKTGRTLTLLTPGGLVLVDGERMHCESEGGIIIDPGETVTVVARKGNRVVVRLAPQKRDDPRSTRTDLAADADAEQEPPLDFELPQS